MYAPKHFLDLKDINPTVLKAIIAHAKELKAQKYATPQLFKGQSLAMIFDKRSTRTRISFELAMKQLGGHTVVLDMQGMQISGSESPEHTAKVLSRYVDAVMVRMSSHEALVELSQHASVPFINALTDHSHPCQVMADMLTIEEKKGSIQGLKIAWFGDYNNVATSFAEAAPIFGFGFTVASPTSQHGSVPIGDNVFVTDDPVRAAEDADVIVTDTWVSMGQEGKTVDAFMPFQVNAKLMAQAKNDAIFMHCMPIHTNEEVTNDIVNSKASVIYDEAENRLHVQKAILAWCLSDSGVQIS